jgi:hypothetical protein
LNALDKVGIAELAQFLTFDPSSSVTPTAAAYDELAKEYKLERDMENCVEFLAWKHAKMVFKDGSTLAFNIKRYTNT